jgi:hypothetical protein
MTNSVMHPPYVGVTGVVTLADVAALRRAWDAVRWGTRRRLMAGVLVSAKTLDGQPTESRRYPPIGVVGELVEALAEFAWPVVHFNTRAAGVDLDLELGDLLDRLPQDERCGLQLNVVRPDRVAFEDYRVAFDGVIVQVNGASLRAGPAADPTGAPLTPRVYAAEYAGAADHALLDLSGGTGRAVDPAWVAEAIGDWSWWAELGIRPGIAGGLGPGCGPALARLAKAVGPEVWRGVSVDAESGLRVPCADAVAGAKHQDVLDPAKVRAYLADAVEALG